MKNHLVQITGQCTHLKALDFPTSHNSGRGVAPSAVRSCPAQLAGSYAGLRCANFGRTKETFHLQWRISKKEPDRLLIRHLQDTQHLAAMKAKQVTVYLVFQKQLSQHSNSYPLFEPSHFPNAPFPERSGSDEVSGTAAKPSPFRVLQSLRQIAPFVEISASFHDVLLVVEITCQIWMLPLLQLPHLFPGHIEGICDFQTKAIPGIAFTQSGEAAQAEKGTKKKRGKSEIGKGSSSFTLSRSPAEKKGVSCISGEIGKDFRDCRGASKSKCL